MFSRVNNQADINCIHLSYLWEDLKITISGLWRKKRGFRLPALAGAMSAYAEIAEIMHRKCWQIYICGARMRLLARINGY